MYIPKEIARASQRFHRVDPGELVLFEDWGLWLEAILNGPCSVMERDGELLLLETKHIVARVRGFKIEVYANEHPPPHFHVKTPNINASFAIEDCRQIAGTISSGDLQKIRYWHQNSKNALIEAWNSTRPTNCTVGPYNGT